jgi:electron transfer flavoprotein beta subunit
MVREGVPLELNEFDVFAVTEAIRLREGHGGEVVTMTMGPPQAEEVLRLKLAMGADRTIHLCDETFAVADTLGTSRALPLPSQRRVPTWSSAAGRRWTPRRGRCRPRRRRSSAGYT